MAVLLLFGYRWICERERRQERKPKPKAHILLVCTDASWEDIQRGGIRVQKVISRCSTISPPS